MVRRRPAPKGYNDRRVPAHPPRGSANQLAKCKYVPYRPHLASRPAAVARLDHGEVVVGSNLHVTTNSENVRTNYFQ